MQLVIVPFFIGLVISQEWELPSPTIDLEANELPIINFTSRLAPDDENLTIMALPVGQGDATIIQCPVQYGGKLTVVDMGSSKYKGFMSKQDVAKYLEGFIIEKVFLSHPDKGHNNFLDAALDNLHPQDYPIIYHSCDWTKYRKYIKTTGITTERIPFCCGRNCPFFKICEGNVTIAVLASEQNNCPKGGSNGDSLVLQVQFADVKVLLPGDFEGSKKLINNFLHCAGQQVQSHIFRLALHGAFNGRANTYKFLKAVRPYYAFSSAGLHKRYYHPRCEIFEELDNYLSTVSTSGHYYTCYAKYLSKPQWIYHTGITKAIFTTSVVEPSTNTVINYIIKFSIDIDGEIEYDLQAFNTFTHSN